jgi:D-sedoheptulose 7-phosphate isomerase
MKTYDFKDDIIKQIQDSSNIKNELIKKNTNTINKISNEIIKAVKKDKKVIWFGNGGSASDAQHLSCEFINKFLIERKPIKSIAITTNTSVLTAVSNDYNFEKVFERQVEGLAGKGDILIGITTSGTSPNIIKALKKGREIVTINIAFTGKNTNQIKKYADFLIDIHSIDVPRIQEAHILVGHIICDIVEKNLFGD